MNKKAITTIGIVVLIFFLTITSASAASFGSRTMRVGSQGEDVKELQTHLKSLGAFTYPNITGYYGSITQKAVTGFQHYHGLTMDGIVGPQTIGKIKSLLGTSKPSSNVDTSSTIHTVKAGETQWVISNKYGITLSELQKPNGFNNSTILYIGQKVKIVQKIIPITWAPTSYGENLDWWTQAQYVFPINAVAKMVVLNDDGSIPFGTAREARTVNVKRTMGANHADTEPLTSADTMKMKKIWGGSLSWIRKPVLIEIEYRGQLRRIAASATSIGHAGLDSAPAFAMVANRSGGYGYGENYDVIKGNGMDGHFDIHFKNSTRHKDGQTDWNHQEMIKKAAGLK
jgi:peptidoglycan hydrolase-like protein with peptidoglycan-binding domain